MRQPGRPLSYTGLTWLHPGANTVGAAEKSDVRLYGRDVPANVGVLIRDGSEIRFEPAPNTPVFVDSARATRVERLRSDAERRASRVSVGSAGFRIVKRVDSIGVRAWDSKRDVLERFPGITHFPLDARWRVAGRFVPLATPKRIAVMTESGVPEEHDIVGIIETAVDGTRYQLTAFSAGDSVLFVTFADGSSGEESYGFRFLRVPLKAGTDRVAVDFNFAYNPDCAFSPYTTCPLPPPENRLTSAVTAGERRLAYDRGER